MAYTSSHGLALAATLLAATIIYKIVTELLSPLSKIPSAGFGAAYSRLAWAFPHEHRGTVTLDLPKLHERLGPLIRIAPNEVSFYSRETYERVHKVGNHFIGKIRGNDASVNLVVASRALEADIMSEFSFGKPIGAIDSWAAGQELSMVAKNDEKATWMPVLSPSIRDLGTTGAKSIPNDWVKNRIHKGTRRFSAGESSDQNCFPNLIRTLVSSGLPPETALSEATENLGPGTDTTSATLAHILWALAQNPGYQNLLHHDLQDASFSTDMTTLENIPRLQACVKEGIRWAAAAAAMLPRIVPPGGIELHGKFVPEGTVLTSSPIWYLHDKTDFPRPELYDPFRWLTSDGQGMSQDALRDRFYIPFSRGANICMGAHFSYLELYLSISQLIRFFHVEPKTPSASSDQLSVGPKEAPHWNAIPLPRRREWVAAVPIDTLDVRMRPRE
ncbi:benzoate 4-monooxygenase cytochrome p450 [Fusarium albosuccineum]|uniref:Benzoate 4-monooxygenase cytochrome p450 n=1 Tax=Fusarium albosuccineum TaxID=1237068 RepID=A0A8H4LLY5_9HYPO|nr:benzoate 4-monooxygenase cytochrome p450 [Fusarium albosuccineum]